MAYALVLACLTLPSTVQAVALNAGRKHGSLRKQNSFCPGVTPCSGHGSCDTSIGNYCWCATGWGGFDCSTEMQTSYEIPHVNDPNLQDMAGVFDLAPMYLQEEAGDLRSKKYIYYDPLQKGWAISKLNSSCSDDICFFASGNTSEPPTKGYVFGEPDKPGMGQHVYYRQLIWDDHEYYPSKLPGYHMIVAYSPDPDAVNVPYEVYMQFRGRYVLQPRYVHRNGKYAIMPVSLDAPGKIWFMLGLLGEKEARRWTILAQLQDPTPNRYQLPTSAWEPASLGMTVGSFCQDRITMDACGEISDSCNSDSPDSDWIKACCRATCGTCSIPESKCVLPKTSINYKGMQHHMKMYKEATR